MFRQSPQPHHHLKGGYFPGFPSSAFGLIQNQNVQLRHHHKHACLEASRALSLVCSRSTHRISHHCCRCQASIRKACCALISAYSRNASSEPSSASSLPSCPWRSVNFPARAPRAELLVFGLLYCVPCDCDDLLTNIGLMSIQQSGLQSFACFSLACS